MKRKPGYQWRILAHADDGKRISHVFENVHRGHRYCRACNRESKRARG